MASNDSILNGSTYRTPTVNHLIQSPNFKRANPVSTPLNRNRALSVTSSASATSTGRKGLNLGLNLISGTTITTLEGPNKTPRRKLFTETHTKSITDIDSPTNVVSESDDDDDILPYSAQVEDEDGLTTKFRRLASKEREILELKNKVKEMLMKKKNLDLELHNLKADIQRELITNFQNNESHLKSPTKKSTGLNFNSLLDDPINSVTKDMNSDHSWLSKPLTFIQQFDNMVTQELGNLNSPNNGNRNDNQDKMINEPIKAMADNLDVMNKVSNSLWSFVNDIKTNLILYEEKTPLNLNSELQKVNDKKESPNFIDLDSNSFKTLVGNTELLQESSDISKGVECKSVNSKIKQDEVDEDDLWGNDYIDIK